MGGKLDIRRRLQLVAGLLILSQLSLSSEPSVRIGIERNVERFTISASGPFVLDGETVDSAGFSSVVAVGADTGTIRREDLVRRMVIDTGGGVLMVRSMDRPIRARPLEAPLSLDGRAYRGTLEILPHGDGSFTVVNELALEDYLLGVVPNELGPETFPELEAMKAQAIAARTYVIRHLGEYASEGFDICATDQCQVYGGFDTEHPLATQAVEDTRGVIATYEGEPIEALYSSTCGGVTEDAANVFGEPVPYLVSTICHYKHPEPTEFRTSRSYPSWEEGLLGIAGVEGFGDAARFVGISGVGEPSAEDDASLAAFVRASFFPDVQVESDLRFLLDQGILVPNGDNGRRGVLLRLLLRKNAFEWRDARLISWDGERLELRLGSRIESYPLRPDAAIFERVGETRLPVAGGSWVGGESLQVRIVDEAVESVVYEAVEGAAADRYSPVAKWETHRTRDELDEAVRGLGVGELRDVTVLTRGPSARAVRVEIQGTTRQRVITGPRLRTLFGLRDSLVYVDAERNARGDLLGMSFFGGGWGHGVGMCQVGAYGMAMEGATAEEILKTYYHGIEIERVY